MFVKEKELVRQVREDWKTNFQRLDAAGLPCARGAPIRHLGGAAAMASLRGCFGGSTRIMFRYVRNHYGIELPVTALVGRRVIIGHQRGIVIHANAVIGDECFLRQNVTLGATNAERGDQAPTLGRGVSLGCGAVILGGITIGDRARIGPNTVVMVDVPADTTVFAGAPRMLTLVNRPPADVTARTRVAGRESLRRDPPSRAGDSCRTEHGARLSSTRARPRGPRATAARHRTRSRRKAPPAAGGVDASTPSAI